MEKIQNYKYRYQFKLNKKNNNIVNNILTKIELFLRRYQTRKQLKTLSPEQLQDIGISHIQAQQEAKKVFWK